MFHLPTPGVLLLLLIAFTLLMWLVLAMWLGLKMLLSWPAAMVGVLLQPRSRSTRPRESRQRSGLFPGLTRHKLGLLVSADPCFSDAASSSLSMLRLNSCSFSDDASFSLHIKETHIFEHMRTYSFMFHEILQMFIPVAWFLRPLGRSYFLWDKNSMCNMCIIDYMLFSSQFSECEDSIFKCPHLLRIAHFSSVLHSTGVAVLHKRTLMV